MTITSALPVEFAGARQRALLARLLISANSAVTWAQLIDAIWDEPPATARQQVHNLIGQLRELLGRVAANMTVVSTEIGYIASVDETDVDVCEFRAGVRAATAATATGRAGEAVALLDGALSRWRGPALVDLGTESLIALAHVLNEERLDACEQLGRLLLERREYARVIRLVRPLLGEYHFHEPLRGLAMIALHRSGRQTEALELYEQGRALARDQLGADPGTELQRLHVSILQSADGTGNTYGTGSAERPAGPWPTIPHQVPADVADFVGREELLAEITAFLAEGRAMPIVTLTGQPGVGKTALAIHIAHRLRAEFPGGQLFVNLHGYSSTAPRSPEQALDWFLRALGTPPERIPRNIDEQSALFRSLLDDRRVLILLDNARTAEQIRPLLPGSGTCAVIVTSRGNLYGLSVLDGAKRIAVDAIAPAAAVALLSRILGTARVDRHPEAALDIAAACGYLPLALRVVATNLAASPELALESMTGRLRGVGGRLSAMAIPDDVAPVRGAIDLSYETLRPGVAGLFRHLGRIPGTTFDRYAVAALADVTPSAAERMLEQLTAMNLLHRPGLDRYQFHDLIRDYARDLGELDDTADRDAACARLLQFYTRAADTASKILYRDNHVSFALDSPPVVLPSFDDKAAALAWLDGELDNLVATTESRSPAWDALPLWRLAVSQIMYLYGQRRDAAWLTQYLAGLASAERLGDDSAVALMRRGLGRYHVLRMAYVPARREYESALDMSRRTDDGLGQARALNGLGALAMEAGDYDEAVSCFAEASDLYGAAGDFPSELLSRIDHDTVIHMMGDTRGAVTDLEEARARADDAGLVYISSCASEVIALSRMWDGDLATSARQFEQILSTARAEHFRQTESATLRNLAEVYFETGDHTGSVESARRALAIAEELNHTWVLVGARVVLGHAYLAVGETTLASENLEYARERARGGLRYWYAAATLGLAAYHRRLGATELAAILAEEAMADPRPRERGRAYAERARVYRAAGDAASCAAYAERARRIAGDAGYRLDETRFAAIAAESWDGR